MSLEYTRSAAKHGISYDDTEHAIRNARLRLLHEYHGETQLLVIGPDRSGAYLEVVLVPALQPSRVIHSDRLRPKFYNLLR